MGSENKIKIAIVCEGGCIVDVYSKHEIEYEIFDYDDIEAEGKSRDEATAIVSKQLRRYDRRACGDV